MNMRKVFKQMLATVAAGAMSMAMVMPVFAKDINYPQTEAWISKTYNTEVGKAETFSFTAIQKTGDGLIGTTADVKMPTIEFTADKTGTHSKRGQITFPTYQEAGKYEYTVKESDTVTPAVTNGDHEKMIMSQAKYTMDVYVTDGENGPEISNIVVNKTNDDAGQTATGKVDISNTDDNDFKFTNTYVQEAGTGTDPTNPDPTYDQFGSLNVSKKVVNANGTTATSDNEFAFTATFAFPTGTDANTLGGIKDANGEVVKLAEGGTYTFNLKANKNMKFTGVPVGTTITVKETATKNYKGSAKVVLNGGTSQTVSANKYYEELTAVNNQKLGQNQNTVDVTNTYNDVPLTGIIMNNLPYIAMIVIGAAALVVYVQNKRKNLQ
ncbi:DUF5979 domain-containing protein [Holdemanella biformis]|uniref:DUF7601 domain-containing protein n=1 Tax=Holdemanella biformis TaxID=1735 RepID=UPI0022E8AB56|nr:DUF5979 domain-containing protein [Holdemanella biformis]